MVPLANVDGPVSGEYAFGQASWAFMATGPWGLTNGDVPILLYVPIEAPAQPDEVQIVAGIYLDNAGVPGALVQQSAPISSLSIPVGAGFNNILFQFPRTPLTTGNYWIVVGTFGDLGTDINWGMTDAASAVYVAHSEDAGDWTAYDPDTARPVFRLMGTS